MNEEDPLPQPSALSKSLSQMNEEDPLPQPGEERGADDASQMLETDIDRYEKKSRIIASLEKVTCQKPFRQHVKGKNYKKHIIIIIPCLKRW